MARPDTRTAVPPTGYWPGRTRPGRVYLQRLSKVPARLRGPGRAARMARPGASRRARRPGARPRVAARRAAPRLAAVVARATAPRRLRPEWAATPQWHEPNQRAGTWPAALVRQTARTTSRSPWFGLLRARRCRPRQPAPAG